MTTVNNALFNWYNNAVNAAGASASGTGGGVEASGFAKLLESLSGKGESSSGSSLMDYLGRRFPGVNFTSGAVGETAGDVQEAFGAAEGDNVAIEPEAAEEIAGNAALSQMLESVLAAFQETAGRTEALEGAHVQRNIMVARVSVRFSISQIDSRSGETLSMNELKSALTEKLEELARNFFGDVETPAEGDGEGAGEVESEAESGGGGANSPAGFFGGSFSFSMYFSSSYLSSQHAADAYASGEEFDFSALDFQAAFAARGNFQNYANSTFSSAVLSGLMAGGFGGEAFTSMLDSGMGMFGMAGQSAWQAGGGYSFQFGGSRSILSELMALYNNSIASSAAPAGTPEPAAVEAPVEAPAETAVPA